MRDKFTVNQNTYEIVKSNEKRLIRCSLCCCRNTIACNYTLCYNIITKQGYYIKGKKTMTYEERFDLAMEMCKLFNTQLIK